MAAARSPLEATGIRLVVATRPDTPSPGRLAVRVIVETRDLALTNKNGRWSGKLDVVYVQQSVPDGKGTKLAHDQVDMNLTEEEFAKAAEEGLIIPKELSAASSAYRLKVVVRDANTGAVGSVEIPREK